MFTVALGLVINEAVVRAGEPRPTLIALYAAMMGLPFVLAADILRRDVTGGSSSQEDDS